MLWFRVLLSFRISIPRWFGLSVPQTGITCVVSTRRSLPHSQILTLGYLNSPPESFPYLPEFFLGSATGSFRTVTVHGIEPGLGCVLLAMVPMIIDVPYDSTIQPSTIVLLRTYCCCRNPFRIGLGLFSGASLHCHMAQIKNSLRSFKCPPI